MWFLLKLAAALWIMWKSQQAETGGKAGDKRFASLLLSAQLSSPFPQAPQGQQLLYIVVSLSSVGCVSPIKFRKGPTPPSGASTHILFVGRLAPEKNIKAILDAAERFPKLSFTLAGRGPLEALVRQQSSQLSNLNYAGHLSRTGIVKLLDEADVVILPSLVEAFGTAALEAMSRARLVLVSKACGISSWPQLCAGLWVMREHESLCEALAHITVLDQSTKTRIASTAHHAALKFHQSAVTGWLNLLTDCARP